MEESFDKFVIVFTSHFFYLLTNKCVCVRAMKKQCHEAKVYSKIHTSMYLQRKRLEQIAVHL